MIGVIGALFIVHVLIGWWRCAYSAIGTAPRALGGETTGARPWLGWCTTAGTDSAEAACLSGLPVAFHT